MNKSVVRQVWQVKYKVEVDDKQDKKGMDAGEMHIVTVIVKEGDHIVDNIVICTRNVAISQNKSSIHACYC